MSRSDGKTSALPRPSAAPTFLYNGIHDEITFIGQTDQLYANDCARGSTIDFYRDPVVEHVSGIPVFIAKAIGYLRARFAGSPAPNTCPPAGQTSSKPIHG
ncbi:MAG TPA: lipase family protein [Amycolatopsis sp.]|nr:lipase family protein [Amycolatopsis sp.]